MKQAVSRDVAALFCPTLLCTGIAALGAPAVYAQGPGMLEEVVVVATKR